MTDTRPAYLTAAAVAVDLLADAAVARAWHEPSALAGFTVGGLAAHLAAQITGTAEATAADASGKERIGLFDHYRRAAWLGADIDNDYNTGIRQSGETAAGDGPAAVLDATRTALQTLAERLPDLDPDTASGTTRWPYATALGDFLATRIMELVVHADDLACSVGLATPRFEAEAFDIAAWILTRLAADRHGQTAVIRALARAERAPDNIAAL